MKRSMLGTALVLPLLALAACGDDDDATGVNNGNTAIVRFVNATGTNYDLALNGAVGTGNGNLGFGGSTSCLSLNAASPGLAVRNAGTTTNVAGFTPNFQSGGNYTVVAVPGANGTTQFVTLSGSNTPAAGQTGVRVLNAAQGFGNFDVYVTAPGGTLGAANATNVSTGNASSWFNVGSGTNQVRFATAGTQNVAFNFGNQNFTAGQNATIVIAPPAAGSTTLRAFTIVGC
jgi:hypothetical protein